MSEVRYREPDMLCGNMQDRHRNVWKQIVTVRVNAPVPIELTTYQCQEDGCGWTSEQPPPLVPKHS